MVINSVVLILTDIAVDVKTTILIQHKNQVEFKMHTKQLIIKNIAIKLQYLAKKAILSLLYIQSKHYYTSNANLLINSAPIRMQTLKDCKTITLSSTLTICQLFKFSL
jgi:hypothetical protein